jgi:hypothetical protein
MKNIDYEQLYYDSLYEIRKKDEEIKYLKDEIMQLKNKKTIDLQKYIDYEFKKYRKEQKWKK